MTRSILFRLILTTLLSMGTVLLLFGVYDYVNQSMVLKQKLDTDVALAQERMGLALPNAVWNFQEQQVKKFIEAEAKSDKIAKVVVSDMEGATFAQTEGTETAGVLKSKLIFDDGGSENEVGWLTVYVDSNSIDDALRGLAFSSIIKVLLLGAILVAVLSFIFQRLVVSPLDEVAEKMATIASGEGDLTQQIVVKRDDEIGRLASSFNEFEHKIAELINHVKKSVDDSFVVSENISSVSSEGVDFLTSQQAETDQIATAITQMASSALEIENNAKLTLESAETANTEANKVREAFQQSIHAIEELVEQLDEAATVISSLESSVQGIVSVLDVIQSIAEQTNLLALNAAIEAARAGEQGRGFAVVADEVRSLASRTQSSTAEIHDTINQLQHGSQSAVAVMEKSKGKGTESMSAANLASESLVSITGSVESITHMSSHISSAVSEQSTVAEALSKNINEAVTAGQGGMSKIQQVQIYSDDMKALASKLQALVKVFKT
ncbi:methyl-accepting chemotaxis protein [Pseudoalteromonas sp. J010]|uniref:methyl-accepting chemotaxis protein n=1 Tax=Pseudoalteromonas sp. J010 TaxID=998465 RepID=UPI000F645A5C|nr:methyl-accepting chemotaxis protein [Pseudoalteromonas sp. J010]RRS10147.1 methyl-accepting chemotaxis protein [Pseudoalteromonas sp. J010]